MADSDTESFHSAVDDFYDVRNEEIEFKNEAFAKEQDNENENCETNLSRDLDLSVKCAGRASDMPKKLSGKSVGKTIGNRSLLEECQKFKDAEKATKDCEAFRNAYNVEVKMMPQFVRSRSSDDLNDQNSDYHLSTPVSSQLDEVKLPKSECELKIVRELAIDSRLLTTGDLKGSKERNQVECNKNAVSKRKVIEPISSPECEDHIRFVNKKMQQIENGTIDVDGWDDWELECSEIRENETEPFEKQKIEERKQENAEEQEKREQENANAKKVGSKTREVENSKSFWEWTDFGDVVAAVGEGITTLSNVVESGLGLPAPEDLARSLPKEISGDDFIKENDEKNSSSVQSYRKLFTGFGANVVTSSLDVLEALGKKTFEKLTVKEQGSHKRRFIFEPERGQNLSQVLRELRESQEEKFVDDGSCMVKRESTFIEFFEKFGGMFHLEGLEMLSKNHLKKITIDKRREVDKIFANDLVNTLEEYQENDTEDFIQQLKGILLTTALPYNGSVLIDSYKRFKERSENLPVTGDEIFVLFLECLADFTAQSVHSVHKMGQLLLITETKGNLEAFSHFLALVGRQISFFSNYFAQYISTADNSFEEIDELVTTVFLAAGDAFSYVQQSFRLLRPLLVV